MQGGRIDPGDWSNARWRNSGTIAESYQVGDGPITPQNTLTRGRSVADMEVSNSEGTPESMLCWIGVHVSVNNRAIVGVGA
jgi:hypothetical protein